MQCSSAAQWCSAVVPCSGVVRYSGAAPGCSASRKCVGAVQCSNCAAQWFIAVHVLCNGAMQWSSAMVQRSAGICYHRSARGHRGGGDGCRGGCRVSCSPSIYSSAPSPRHSHPIGSNVPAPWSLLLPFGVRPWRRRRRLRGRPQSRRPVPAPSMPSHPFPVCVLLPHPRASQSHPRPAHLVCQPLWARPPRRRRRSPRGRRRLRRRPLSTRPIRAVSPIAPPFPTHMFYCPIPAHCLSLCRSISAHAEARGGQAAGGGH